MTVRPVDEPVLCPLFCGQPRHEDPGPAPYGMTCPGHNARVDEAKAFEQELAWRKEVAAAYGETLAASDEYTELLKRRRDDADDRVAAGRKWMEDHPDEPHLNPLRSKATHDDLVDHVNKITPEVVAEIEREASRPVVEEFEPVGKPLRVPAKDLSRRGSRLEVVRGGGSSLPAELRTDGDKPITAAELKEARSISDSALFLDPEAD
jgi:hypothetical protein